MKEIDVMVGGVYEARVSGNLVPVRIDGWHAARYLSKRKQWMATNLRTNKVITVTAQRLRRRLAGGEGGAPLT